MCNVDVDRMTCRHRLREEALSVGVFIGSCEGLCNFALQHFQIGTPHHDLFPDFKRFITCARSKKRLIPTVPIFSAGPDFLHKTFNAVA